jgi:hypothetical protein
VWQASRSYDESDSTTNPEKESAFEERQRESLLRPTPEMQRILARRAAQEIRRQSLSWKDQLAEYNQRSVFFLFYRWQYLADWFYDWVVVVSFLLKTLDD